MSRATLDAPAVRPLKRAIVGRPMASGELEETLLPKTLALPIFASDPLSSVAYATESALVVLVAASAGAAHLVFPISIAIAALLAIVVASYRQTVQAYETSGGAYIVAKDNLGTLPSLVGAAALLTDYVLTVAVSIAAGIFAVTSLAPSLSKVWFCGRRIGRYGGVEDMSVFQSTPDLVFRSGYAAWRSIYADELNAWLDA